MTVGIHNSCRDGIDASRGRPDPSATRIKRRGFLLHASAIALTGCISATSPLTVACAAGWRSVVEPKITAFRSESSVGVRTIYDGTGRLVSLINAGLAADIIIAADASFLGRLSKGTDYAEPEQLRRQTARLVATPRSQGEITWPAVLAGDCRLSLPLESTSAIGDALATQLDQTNWNQLVDAAVVRRTTVTEVASDVAALEAADAGIVWDTTWPNDQRLSTVEAPPLSTVTGHVTLVRHATATPLASELADQLSEAIRATASE